MIRRRRSASICLAFVFSAGCAPLTPPIPVGDKSALDAQQDAADPADVWRFTAADGASLACKRYALADAPPVLLIHGLAINVESWDLPPRDGPGYAYRSLASVLRS